MSILPIIKFCKKTVPLFTRIKHDSTRPNCKIIVGLNNIKPGTELNMGLYEKRLQKHNKPKIGIFPCALVQVAELFKSPA